MTACAPLLYADDSGVWRKNRTGNPFGIAWSEITVISGYKLDGITQIYTVVELEHPSGHFLELYADWPGFTDVVLAVTARIPGIPADWVSRVEELEPRHGAVTVWHRDGTVP